MGGLSMSESTEAAVRAEARAWLEANWSAELGLAEWRGRLIDSGWGVPSWPALASLAKAGASEAYLRAAIDTLQIHGGIGFTWDNDTHLWFKRAKGSEVFLGGPEWHRELMLREMGL